MKLKISVKYNHQTKTVKSKFKNIKLFFAIMFATVAVWFVADYAVFGLKEIGVDVGGMGFGVEARAADYYVATNGNDSWSGTLKEPNGELTDGPWKTIGKVNAVRFSDCDTVRFKRDCTYNDATLYTPGVNNFTFEDYGTGSKPLFDGDVNRPIKIGDSRISNLTIRNLDISGQDWQLSKDSNLYIAFVNGITIDGVIGNGHKGGNSVDQIGKTAITITKTTGTVIIKNCELYNWGPDSLLTGDIDLMAIVVMYITSGEFRIYNNTIHDIAADGVHLYRNTGAKISVYNNTFYNFGEQATDIKGASNIEVYENTYYTEANFEGGTGGSGGGANLIGCSDQSPYGYSNDNITIRNNYFNGSNTRAIYVACGTKMNVFNNYIKNTTGGGILVSTATNASIFNNVIINSGTGIYENNAYAGTKIYNNIIYNSVDQDHNSIFINCCNATEIKNNLIYTQGNASAYAFYYLWNGCGTDPEVSHNLWYSSNDRRIWWKGIEYNVSDYDFWEANHEGDIFSNPLFIDSDTNDFHLQPTSPAIDAGIDVGLTEDFDGVSVPQGLAPDIGAYEYISSDTTPPILSNPSPTGTLSTGTTQTTISLTTNENATCRYSTNPNTAYNSMTDTFSTTGGTAHSQIISGLSDGNTYNYYVRCIDTAGNPNTDDYAIIFSVEAGVSDSTPPTGSVSINNGDTTANSPNTTLSLSASDSSGVAEMKISNTNDFSSAIAETYNTVKSWALSAGDGLKTVYAWFKDTIGNWTAENSPETDTITLDTTPPVTSPSRGGDGTVSDTIPPTKPSEFTAAPADSQIVLAWNNPTDSDFVRVKILRKEGSAPASHNDSSAIVVYEGTNEEYTDIELDNNTTYHYAIFAYDEKPNYSNILAISAQPIEGEIIIKKPETVQPICHGFEPANLFGLDSDMVECISLREAKIVNSYNQRVELGNVGKQLYQRIVSAEEQASLELNFQYSLAYFVNNHTTTTRILGAGERAGVINSYKSAFNKLPETESEWQDVIKIANGRWPSQRSEQAESKAKQEFKTVYLRDSNMDSPNDNAAVTVIAYGLRPANRNMDSEKAGIRIFKNIYDFNPASAIDWDIVRAIAYSGAER